MAEQHDGGQGGGQAANDGGAGAATEALVPFASALVKAAEAKPQSTADPRVSAAFALGWHMSELYTSREPHKDGEPPDLPGLSALSETQRTAILIDQIEVGVHQLSDPISQSGVDAVDVTPLKVLRQTEPSEDPVLATHEDLFGKLTAADFRLGKAYGLGRALADSCRQPRDSDTLMEELKHERVANLLRWLDDLETGFPAHAASSVFKSLAKWSDALHPPSGGSVPAGAGRWNRLKAWFRRVCEREMRMTAARVGEAPPTTPLVDPQAALPRLRRQGELWRSLLSGEKQGSDMLEIANYLDAAKAVLSRMAAIARGVVSRMPLLSLLVGGLIGGGVYLLSQGSSSQLVAGATSIFAALGLTWKGVGGALGQFVGKLERPLWGAVLDDAIADAITLLPGNKAEKGGRRQVAVTLARARAQRTGEAAAPSSQHPE